jgi:hypothetical protein
LPVAAVLWELSVEEVEELVVVVGWLLLLLP